MGYSQDRPSLGIIFISGLKIYFSSGPAIQICHEIKHFICCSFFTVIQFYCCSFKYRKNWIKHSFMEEFLAIKQLQLQCLRRKQGGQGVYRRGGSGVFFLTKVILMFRQIVLITHYWPLQDSKLTLHVTLIALQIQQQQTMQ